MLSTAKSLAVAIGLACAWSLPPAFAADAPRIDCAQATSTVEINFCADKDYQVADKALNAAYAKALADVRKRGGEKPYDAKSYEDAFRNAQRAWLAYRDAECKDLVAQEWSGGTGTTAAVLGCLTRKTAERTKELLDRDGNP